MAFYTELSSTLGKELSYRRQKPSSPLMLRSGLEGFRNSNRSYVVATFWWQFNFPRQHSATNACEDRHDHTVARPPPPHTYSVTHLLLLFELTVSRWRLVANAVREVREFLN